MKKIVCLIILLSFFIIACEDSNSTEPSHQKPSETENNETEIEEDHNDKVVVKPLMVEPNEVVQFVNWISNQEVIYIQNKSQESTIFLYNLITGEKTPLFVTQDYVQLVEVSANRKQILIQSSESENEATLTLLNITGKVSGTTTIPSAELYIDWNKIDPTKILITSFLKDWTYKSYVWNIKTSVLKPIEVNQPFNEWMGAESLQYINWKQEQPSLLAPLETLNVSSNQTKTILDEVYYFKSYGDWFFTLSPSAIEVDHLTYQLYDANYQKLGSFDVFQLSRFSNWLIPHDDYVEAIQTFYFFQPVGSGDADTYDEGFQLTTYQLDKGISSVLMEGLENMPIECSPNGTYCLYGHQLENIISFEEKEIIPLIKEGE